MPCMYGRPPDMLVRLRINHYDVIQISMASTRVHGHCCSQIDVACRRRLNHTPYTACFQRSSQLLEKWISSPAHMRCTALSPSPVELLNFFHFCDVIHCVVESLSNLAHLRTVSCCCPLLYNCPLRLSSPSSRPSSL